MLTPFPQFFLLLQNLFSLRLELSFPFLQCHKAISRATRFSLSRSAGPLSSGVLASGGAERGARLLGGRALYSFRLRSSSSSVPPTSSISPARVRFPRRFSGDDGISGVVSGEICARLVLVFLFALGKDLLCSPVSSLFPGWCRCRRPRTSWWAPSSFRRRWRHLCLRRPGAPSAGDCFSFFSVGQIVDGLSTAQIHPDGRSGVVVFAAQPCYGV